MRSVDPDVDWTLTNQLLAGILDQVRHISWQWSDGKSQPPEPIERPGVAPTERKQYGRTTRTPEEVAAYLRRFAPRRPTEEVSDG